MTSDRTVQAAREQAMARVAAVWQGDADLGTLDELVTAGYVGHIGSRTRSLAELKRDISAYLASARDVRFRLERRFAEGDYVASRWTAQGQGPAGENLVAAGLNISRWDGDRLAEEWAVWEPLHPGSAD